MSLIKDPNKCNCSLCCYSCHSFSVIYIKIDNTCCKNVVHNNKSRTRNSHHHEITAIFASTTHLFFFSTIIPSTIIPTVIYIKINEENTATHMLQKFYLQQHIFTSTKQIISLGTICITSSNMKKAIMSKFTTITPTRSQFLNQLLFLFLGFYMITIHQTKKTPIPQIRQLVLLNIKKYTSKTHAINQAICQSTFHKHNNLTKIKINIISAIPFS